MNKVLFTAHALTLVLDIISFFIFYSNSRSSLTLGYDVMIDNLVGDIVWAFIDVVVKELKGLNSMLLIGIFNLVNEGRKAHVVGLSLIVKNIVFDLLMLLNDSIRIKSVI